MPCFLWQNRICSWLWQYVEKDLGVGQNLDSGSIYETRWIVSLSQVLPPKKSMFPGYPNPSGPVCWSSNPKVLPSAVELSPSSKLVISCIHQAGFKFIHLCTRCRRFPGSSERTLRTKGHMHWASLRGCHQKASAQVGDECQGTWHWHQPGAKAGTTWELLRAPPRITSPQLKEKLYYLIK